MTTANDDILVIPQIKSVTAARDIDAILDVAGIDAICLGPNDLSGSVGLLRQLAHPTIIGAIEHVLARCKARGIPACTGVTLPPDQALAMCLQGATSSSPPTTPACWRTVRPMPWRNCGQETDTRHEQRTQGPRLRQPACTDARRRTCSRLQQAGFRWYRKRARPAL